MCGISVMQRTYIWEVAGLEGVKDIFWPFSFQVKAGIIS
jgi:hypothetical protein